MQLCIARDRLCRHGDRGLNKYHRPFRSRPAGTKRRLRRTTAMAHLLARHPPPHVNICAHRRPRVGGRSRCDRDLRCRAHGAGLVTQASVRISPTRARRNVLEATGRSPRPLTGSMSAMSWPSCACSIHRLGGLDKSRMTARVSPSPAALVPAPIKVASPANCR